MHITHDSDCESPLVGQYHSFPFPVASAKADQVFDADGNAYWDFYGGHCVTTTGHSHPEVVRSLCEQAEKLLFYSTAVAVPVRERAASELLKFSAANFGRVFFCNSGAEANENALKLAVQITGRHHIIAFSGAFHGRTLFALSATDNDQLHQPFQPLLPKVTRAEYNNFEALAHMDFHDIAAVIVEPVQSMAGVREASKEWLEELTAKAHASGALVIFDEVQTGMGRTGDPFVATSLENRPDLLTSAKGIASGIPMGAVLIDQQLADDIPPNALGSTFGGGPLACAGLLATMSVIREESLQARAAEIENVLRSHIPNRTVSELRGRGLLLGLNAGEKAKQLREHFLQDKILVGTSKDPRILRLMPPLTISDEAVNALLESMRTFH